MSEFSIGGVSSISLTKRQLIDVINQTFPDDYGIIAVVTECKTTQFPDKTKVCTQSIMFGKPLELS